MNRTRAALAVSLAVMLPLAASAENYTLAVEPSYPPDQALEVYTPLLEYLGKQTGHTFELVAVRNYHFYWRDLRAQKPIDFVFEEAHFTDYRINRSQYEPLARKAEPAVYVLMADPEIAERGLGGLVGQNIVSMPAPSMGFALLAQMYKNPVSQPEIRSEASTWRDGVEMVFSGDAKAAMVPDFIAQQYPNLVEVSRSGSFPGAAFAASPQVPAEVKTAVREALLKLAEDPAAFDILAELGAAALSRRKHRTTSAAKTSFRAFLATSRAESRSHVPATSASRWSAVTPAPAARPRIPRSPTITTGCAVAQRSRGSCGGERANF